LTSGVIAQCLEQGLVASRFHSRDKTAAPIEDGQGYPASCRTCGLGTQPQLQPLFDQTGQAGSLLRRQSLGAGQQLIVQIERRLHRTKIQISALNMLSRSMPRQE